MTIPSLFRRAGWQGAAALLALLGPAGACSAASYVVQNTAATGAGSLLDALTSAQADSDASDTITFAPAVTGTIALGGTELAISKSMTITGPGANVLAIDAGGSSRVFDITAGTVAVSGLTLKNGNDGSRNGGGIYNLGTLTVTGCTFSGNAASDYGGGLYNDGTLTITGSTFTGNTATYYGGGLYNGRTATITGCTFSGNAASDYGGGLTNDGTLTITGSTFTGNTATYYGGLFNGEGRTTLTASLFAGNTGGDIGGAVTSGGSNLLEDADGNGFTNGVSNDQTGVSSPMLGPLANNGGPTQTCALLLGSPAIDADYSSGTAADQRGYARPVGARGDIGAYEYGASAPATLSSITVTPASPSTTVTGTQQFTATATYSDSSTADVTGTATWASSDTSKATISAAGLATGVAEGTADITATFGGITSGADTLTVTHTPATLIVTNNLDDGSVGCLRTVLAGAGPGDTITFAPAVTGTITLNGNELGLSQDVTITGPGANVLAIDAGGSSRVFDIAPTTVAVSGLTLENGNASDGGCIYNQGTLTVTACVLAGNAGDYGAGIFNASGGAVTLEGDTLSGNNAAIYGGGLYSEGTLTATGSTFSANSAAQFGGGILSQPGGTVTLVNDTFSGNTAASDGGGGLYSGGTAAVTSSTFSGNSAPPLGGGGIENYGTLTVTASLFVGSVGGDIHSASGTVTSGGSNLLGDADGNGFTNGVSQDQTGVSASAANLGPLADNGGPTRTCAVLAGSPAIGGDLALLTPTDQRGAARTTARHTIGAYEYQPLRTHTHLLWTNSDGTAAIWTVNADGSFTSTPGYGPFADWTARSIADGADGKTRLLWTRADGQNAVWTVNDADGTYTSTPGYGPYDGGNWAVTSLAVGPDNLTRLQWKHSPDGMSSIWTVAGDASFTSTPGFGPYADAYGPWTASAMTVGGDGLSRLLWQDSAGRFSVWTLDALSNFLSTPAFGPVPDWTASAIAGGPDANERLLLNRSDGGMAVWTVDAASTITPTPLYGPIPSWNCHGLAVGPDALSRVLWSRIDGMSSVWTINGDGSYVSTPGYGPYSGWSAVSLAAGP